MKNRGRDNLQLVRTIENAIKDRLKRCYGEMGDPSWLAGDIADAVDPLLPNLDDTSVYMAPSLWQIGKDYFRRAADVDATYDEAWQHAVFAVIKQYEKEVRPSREYYTPEASDVLRAAEELADSTDPITNDTPSVKLERLYAIRKVIRAVEKMRESEELSIIKE